MKIKTLVTANFGMMVAAVLVQQVIVASSSYWLSDFAQNLRLNQFSWVLLGAYLASLLLPYLPGAVAHYYQSLWNFEILENFYDKTLSTFRGKIGLWNHEEFKGQKESLLIKDGPQYLGDLGHYIFDVISISFNAILNILVVVWLLDTEFLIAYLLGLGITFFVLNLQNKTHENMASKVETEKNKITRHLASAWDHWALENAAFLDSWNKSFQVKKLLYKGSLVKLSGKKEFGSVILSITSFLPTLIATIYFAQKNFGSIPDLLNLVILLPRLFMILGHTTSLIYLIRDYSIMKSRAEVITQMSDQELDPQWESRINLEGIKMQGVTDFNLAKKLDETSKGYWTITGSNGSGKSSWLMKLKQELGAKACYLPPKSSLGIDQIETSLSTGQKIKAQIQLALNSGVGILLLDEWDANLDEKNRNEILETLRDVGIRMCVIDIRHRV